MATHCISHEVSPLSGLLLGPVCQRRPWLPRHARLSMLLRHPLDLRHPYTASLHLRLQTHTTQSLRDVPGTQVWRWCAYDMAEAIAEDPGRARQRVHNILELFEVQFRRAVLIQRIERLPELGAGWVTAHLAQHPQDLRRLD